jgi:hypothetical protein
MQHPAKRARSGHLTRMIRSLTARARLNDRYADEIKVAALAISGNFRFAAVAAKDTKVR